MLSADKYHLYASDPAEFRNDLIIDHGGKPVELGTCIDGWQDADFRAMDRAWLHAVGRADAPATQPFRAYIERPRGHSKTADQAIMNAWALGFAPRVVRGYAASGKADQAKFLRDAILVLCRLNPLLQSLLDVDKYTVTNVAKHKGKPYPSNGSTLEILSHAPQTSWGLLFDWCTVDEVTTFSDAGQEFWSSLLSAAGKRSNALLLSIANCGWTGHWAFKVREQIRQNPRWYFSSLDGPQTSFVSPEELADQEAMLPPQVLQRVWLNRWVDGSQGDSLPSEFIRATLCREGPSDKANRGTICVQSCDLGWRRDAAALAVFEIDCDRQKIVLLNRRRWIPREIVACEVCFAEIVDKVRAWRNQYAANVLVADAYQAVAMLQTLASEGMTCFPIAATSASKLEEARAILECLENKTLELYPCALIDDLRKSTVVERPGNLGGLRIESPRDESGHGDELSALLVALPSMLVTMRNNSPHEGPTQRWGQPAHSESWGTRVDENPLNFSGEPGSRSGEAAFRSGGLGHLHPFPDFANR